MQRDTEETTPQLRIANMTEISKIDITAIFAFCSLFLTFGNACPGVEIISRSGWGARSPQGRLRSLSRPINHVIIGHTVTPECQTLSDCAARMRSLQNVHMRYPGWGDIGYNFVIGGDGKVYEGVGWEREGIHTLGWNSKSYGIAFIGNYMNKTPNNSMLKAARALIVCGIRKGYIAQSREIHGARDATCTLSPGDKLYEIIRDWPSFKGGPLQGYKC